MEIETIRKIYAPHELLPSEPIHPGEILKDELVARGISQRKFAALIGVSYSVLNEVINGVILSGTRTPIAVISAGTVNDFAS